MHGQPIWRTSRRILLDGTRLSKVLSRFNATYTLATGARRCSLSSCVGLAFLCISFLAITAGAQSLTVRLKVVSLSPAVIRIEGDTQQSFDTWFFRDSYGRLSGLGGRVANFSVADALGKSGAVRQLAPAEYKSERPVSHFNYDVHVAEPANPMDESHVSWLNELGGYLMLADLLPLNVTARKPGAAVLLEIQLPVRWGVASSIPASAIGRYEVLDAASAVFFVGRDLHVKRKQLGRSGFLLATIGDWPFSADSVIAIAEKIIKDHQRHVGFELRENAVLMLAPFSNQVGAERWTAETRGGNVTLVLGRNSPANVLLSRLGVVLTHELFHLWVPGALDLSGDYAWFYEGFTLYQALRCAVRLGFVDFQEYLSTMARVYDSYLATVDRDRLSLVEASQGRWTGASSLIYDKGMLLAFLCDLSLRAASGNRRTLDDFYRNIFREQQHLAGRDGTETLISLLNQTPGAEQFASRYLSTPASVSLESELPAYGLMIESSNNRRQLMVGPRLSNQQRQLLQSLGYRVARK